MTTPDRSPDGSTESPTDQAPSATDSAPGRVHCALCDAPIDGFGCPVQYRVIDEIEPGRVYAIGVPRGISEATLHAHLRALAERTKAELVVFVEPLSLVELERFAIRDARAARDAADARAARTWDQREAYRHQAAELAAELATLRRPTAVVVREVDGRLVVDWPDGRGNTIATPEVVEGWADQINALRTQLAEGAEIIREGQAIIAQGQQLLAEADQRAELLRRQVDERTADRDRLADEIERLRIVETASVGAHALLADAEAKIKRLYALIAAADEYGDRHVIDLREDGWTIAHPLSCRAIGIFACPLNHAATSLPAPPKVGKYTVTVEEGRLVIGERVAEIEREVGRA